MAEYRLLYADLLSGTIYGELPAISVSATETLNAAGRLTASVPLVPEPDDLFNNQELAVARTAVYLERDQVPIWGGILWGVDADLQAQTLNITCEGFHSYFKRKRMLFQFDVTAEQLDLGYQIVIDSQFFNPADLGIVQGTGAGTTGVTRAIQQDIFTYSSVGEALERIALVDRGFDFAYLTTRDPGTGDIVNTLQFTFPAEGRRTENVFEIGTNCAVLNYSEDGTFLCNSVLVLGGGEGDARWYNNYDNAPLFDVYPFLQDVVTDQNIVTLNQLNDAAKRRLSRGAGPIRRVKLTTFPDSEPPLGSYRVGDQARVIASMGWARVDDTFRIVEQTLDLSDGGEVVTIDLAGLESFERI